MSLPATPISHPRAISSASAFKEASRLLISAMLTGIAFSALAIALTLIIANQSEAQTAHALSRAFDADTFGRAKPTAPTAITVASSADIAQVAMAAPAGEVDWQPVDEVSEQDGPSTPTVGSLFLSDGCGSSEWAASEREWFVTISGDEAEIRVMQTFTVPTVFREDQASASDEDTGREMAEENQDGPWFHVVLPRGAKLSRLTLETDNATREGEVVDLEMLGRSALPKSDAALRVFVSEEDGMQVASSDSISGLSSLASGDTIVVTYVYRVKLANVALANLEGVDADVKGADTGETNVETAKAFALALDLAPKKSSSAMPQDSSDPTAVAESPAATVWVSWVEAPASITALPLGAVLERADGNIVGLSWTMPRLEPNTQFVFGWK